MHATVDDIRAHPVVTALCPGRSLVIPQSPPPPLDVRKHSYCDRCVFACACLPPPVVYVFARWNFRPLPTPPAR